MTESQNAKAAYGKYNVCVCEPSSWGPRRGNCPMAQPYETGYAKEVHFHHFDLLAKDGDAFKKNTVVPLSSKLLLSNITEGNTRITETCLLIYKFYEQDKLEENEYVNRYQRFLVAGQETKVTCSKSNQY